MKAVSLPFRLDSYGKVTTTDDLSKIWADRVKTVVATARGERVMLPRFGSNLPNDLLDILPNIPGYADVEMRTAFSDWLPDVTFESTEIAEDDAGTLNLVVIYRIPKFEQTGPLTYSVLIG